MTLWSFCFARTFVLQICSRNINIEILNGNQRFLNVLLLRFEIKCFNRSSTWTTCRTVSFFLSLYMWWSTARTRWYKIQTRKLAIYKSVRLIKSINWLLGVQPSEKCWLLMSYSCISDHLKWMVFVWRVFAYITFYRYQEYQQAHDYDLRFLVPLRRSIIYRYETSPSVMNFKRKIWKNFLHFSNHWWISKETLTNDY